MPQLPGEYPAQHLNQRRLVDVGYQLLYDETIGAFPTVKCIGKKNKQLTVALYGWERTYGFVVQKLISHIHQASLVQMLRWIFTWKLSIGDAIS